MRFDFFTNEFKEVLEIIKEVFNINLEKDNFVLQNNQKILLLKDNDKVVGLTLISLKEDPFKNIKTYYLDYFCIKEEYQHRSLGTKMFEKIVELAKENHINYIELTSNKDRVAARRLYLNCGMSIKDTNVFIKQI